MSCAALTLSSRMLKPVPGDLMSLSGARNGCAVSVLIVSIVL